MSYYFRLLKSLVRGSCNIGAVLRPVCRETPRARQSLDAAVQCAAEPLERRVLMSVFTPAQVRQAYAVQGMTFASTPAYGQGQTIAIVIPWDDPTDVSDANSFSTKFNTEADPLPQFNDGLSPDGISDPTIRVIDQNGNVARVSNMYATGLVGWQNEQSLDIEWAHVMAPFANIVVVEAASANDNDLLAADVTAAAYNNSSFDVSVVSNSWSEAEPSGSTEAADDGSFAMPGSHQAVTFLAAAGDLGANNITNSAANSGYPSMSPAVISVGGTSLSINSDGTYGGESAWSYNSVSTQGGGGGISQHESIPSYQSGNVNGASSTKRVTPDVSMDADINTGVWVLNTTTTGGDGTFPEGGTSLATPMWAGLIALADQDRAANSAATLSTGDVHSALYTSLPATAFLDETSGNNGYSAASGYDLATGLGSPFANILVPGLAGYGSTTQLAFAGPPSTTITAGTGALPPLTVDVKNSLGSIITTDISAVKVEVYYHGVNNGAELSGGTATVHAVSDVATLSDLWLNAPPTQAGTYTVLATDGVDTPAVFNFTVAAAPVRTSSPTFATLVSLSSSGGSDPFGGVIRDSSGDLFGTTDNGGTYGQGAVYEYSSSNVFTTLYSFTGGTTDGGNPTGSLAIDSSGNLFGTAEYGGDYGGSTGYGVVFKLSGAGHTTFTKIASFSGTGGIGINPSGPVTFDSGGNLYGTTIAGGASGYGTVFEVASGTTTITTVASFANTNGAAPYSGVIIDSAGDLFGTTTSYYYTTGGVTLPGSVFEIAAGTGTITTMAAFGTGVGATPYGALVMDASGNLYGTTNTGGTSGDGTVFDIDRGGSAINTVASFNGTDGANPYSGLAIDGTGDLFGTTENGGSSNAGTVFEIPAGSNSITVLESFTGTGTVGYSPYYGSVVLDMNGNLYGTTLHGGTNSAGTVFKLSLVATAAFPAWLKPGSAATWDAGSAALNVDVSGTANFGQAIITDNPGSYGDTPDVTVSASTDELVIQVPPTGSFNSPTPITFGTLTIDSSATAVFAQTPSPDFLKLNLSGLTINGSGGSQGTFDIGDNKVYIAYTSSPAAAIQGWLLAGYNGSAWTGTGITSSAAAADSAEQTAIGWADSADGLIAGQPANTIELMYTLYGDTELVGTVGFNDFTRLTQHYNQTSGGTWDVGDFSYDGTVNITDFDLMTRTYNTTLGGGAQPDDLFNFSFFAPASTYAADASLGYHFADAADLNGDGYPDLIVSNWWNGDISVLLGNGDGTFQSMISFSAGTRPEGIITADVNNDGKLDIVCVDWSGFATVLLGNGDGTFQAAQTFATGAYPMQVAVADVNDDGKPDLIVPNYNLASSGPGTVSVLLGNGDGTFQAQETFTTGSSPAGIKIADVNGDGKADLLVSCAYGSGDAVSVLLGNGDGTFQPQMTFATGNKGLSIDAADLNGDGKIDLVVSNGFDGTVSVLLGNGNGTFQAQQTLAVGSSPHQVVIADVNGDGIPDLIVPNWGDSDVSVLLGNGNGTFQTQQTFSVSGDPVSVAVVDVNGDGKLDLVLADYGSNKIYVLLNTSSY